VKLTIYTVKRQLCRNTSTNPNSNPIPNPHRIDLVDSVANGLTHVHSETVNWKWQLMRIRDAHKSVFWNIQRFGRKQISPICEKRDVVLKNEIIFADSKNTREMRVRFGLHFSTGLLPKYRTVRLNTRQVVTLPGPCNKQLCYVVLPYCINS